MSSRHDDSEQVLINIFGKEYHVICKKEERGALLSASALLDTRMREIRNTGKIFGTERIAVMAALNIAHELIESRQNSFPDNDIAFNKIVELQRKIDAALEPESKNEN